MIINNNNELKALIQTKLMPLRRVALSGLPNHIPVNFEINTMGPSKSHSEEAEEEAKKKKDRPLLDLYLIIDCSGSMEGEKIQFAKKAIRQCIASLRANDRFTLLKYSSQCSIVFQDEVLKSEEEGGNTQRLDLYNMVDSIEARGGTNVWDAFNTAKTLISNKKSKKDDEHPRVKRIFFFSDGQANEGITSKDKISQFISIDLVKALETTVCSFGIGSDFDEKLMRAISDSGQGDFFYIDQAGKIPAFVDKGLAGLESILATEAVLKVRAAKNSSGVLINKIYGYDQQDLISGVKIGDVRAKNLKSMIIDMVFSPTSSSISTDPVEVLTFELSFKPASSETTQKLAGSLYLRVTDDDSDPDLGREDPVVKVSLAIQESGEQDAEILKLLEANNKSQAIQAKQKQIDALKKVMDIDPTGHVAAILKMAEDSLASLQEVEFDMESAKKQIGYSGYRARRNSTYALF